MQNLSGSEKRFVNEYIKQRRHRQWSGIAQFVAGLVSILGLVLFVSATSITLRNLSDYTLKWVLLPGTAIGFFLILFGLGLLFLQKRRVDEEKLHSVLKKIAGA